MSPMPSFIRCECIAPSLVARHGKYAHYSAQEALAFQAMGEVRIAPGQIPEQKIKNENYLHRAGFGHRGLTKVAWVQNFNKSGGAEISNFAAVSVGTRLGFDIVGYVLNRNRSFDLLRDSDIIIVNNMHDYGKDEVVAWLTTHDKPWVVYCHDYLETNKELFLQSKLNVFISPAHMQHYVSMFGGEMKDKSLALPLAFDVTPWRSSSTNRMPGTVFIPAYLKCRDNALEFMQQHKELRYYIADNTMPCGANVFSLGKVEPSEMPSVYPRYEYVLHQPEHRFAGDRVIFEAILAGCKLIYNTHPGHTSWDFDWKNENVLREILPKAVYTFWREVAGCLRAL